MALFEYRDKITVFSYQNQYENEHNKKKTSPSLIPGFNRCSKSMNECCRIN